MDELLSIQAKYNQAVYELQQSKEDLQSLRSEKDILLQQIQNNSKLINAIESDKQALTLQLQVANEKVKVLEQEKVGLIMENEKSNERLNDLQQKNSKMQKDSQVSTSKTQHLRKQNRVLGAKVKQIQYGVEQNSRFNQEQNNESESTDSEVFEVKKILAHKYVGEARHFLVRWKSFDPSEDSWVAEKHLTCPSILNAYLKKAKII